MRRNGRQQNLFGAERTPSKEITAASIRGLSILGIVVNPKKKEPVLAVTDGTYVGLRSLLEAHPLKREGVGYYDNDSDEPASVISEYPRCHTPSGVASKGQGYGTSLYTALSEEIPEDLAQNAELDFLWKDLMEGPEYFLDTDKDALLSIDVRGLDKRAMNIIAICYAVNGFKDPDIDALWYRWENRMDPSSQVRQQGLFTPNARAGALSDVLEARRLTDWDSIANLP